MVAILPGLAMNFHRSRHPHPVPATLLTAKVLRAAGLHSYYWRDFQSRFPKGLQTTALHLPWLMIDDGCWHTGAAGPIPDSKTVLTLLQGIDSEAAYAECIRTYFQAYDASGHYREGLADYDATTSGLCAHNEDEAEEMLDVIDGADYCLMYRHRMAAAAGDAAFWAKVAYFCHSPGAYFIST